MQIPSPPPYSAIYIAPHLDDVALSCGGQVFDRTETGERILIVTVMAGSSALMAESEYIASLHERWQLAGDAAAERRGEDAAACAILGADYLHLEVPDCIYRLDPTGSTPLYNSDAEIFGEIHPAEHGLPAKIAQMFRALPPADKIVAPLTVGHHVDHLLVRAAAELAWADHLWYYEDYPYVENRGYLRRILGDNLRAWRPAIFDVSAHGLQAKFDAIWAFRSQLSTFFGSRAEMETRVRGYNEIAGGERLWEKV
jgi:LmbE family N-acetylglucosaminyl deacetylase